MPRMVIALYLAVASMVLLSTAAHAAESELKIISGIVRQIDWVGSTLTVAVGEYGSDGPVTFLVPQDAQMTSGTAVISLSDIQIGDEVKIVYAVTDEGRVLRGLQDTNTVNNEG